MNEINDSHEPSAEFRAALRRDMLDAFRRERQFGAFAPPSRGRRIGTVIGIAAGAVITLSVGLVLGFSTGVASAESTDNVIRDRPTANKTPMRNAIAKFSCAALAIAPKAAPPLTAVTPRVVATEQQGIPTIDLPAPSAKTTQPLGILYGVREVAGGKLLVNDGGNRQLLLFDATLSSSIVTLDSTPGGLGYPVRRPRPIPLSPYRGDSSVLPDPQWRMIRILDGSGQVARTVALPVAPIDLSKPAFADDRGRLLYAGLHNFMSVSDSAPIVRVDLVSGRVDTVASLSYRGGPYRGDTYRFAFATDSSTAIWRYRGGGYGEVLLPNRDDWAVLSNGTIAVVRGRDYHIDWIRGDGSTSSTAALPFDWPAWNATLKRQADSARRLDSLQPRLRPVVAGSAVGRGSGGRRDSIKAAVLQVKVIGNYAVRYDLLSFGAGGSSAVMPDLDGNLWILPTESASSPATSLVYDVVNSRGQLFQRVRVPAGRSIVGFGQGGVVYLVSGDRANGYQVEKTRLSRR